jgi:RimJ/RimL family protein N-acetyltransferase
MGVQLRQPTATELTLRKATENDGAFLLAVRNRPEVRAQSKNQDVIPEATHRAWLKTQLNSSATAIWIVEDNGQSEGYVRVQDIGEGTWLLSIALDQPFRGKRHGSWAVREACRMLKETHGARCLVAEVFSTNRPARRFFEDAGFIPTANLAECGLVMTRFELSLSMPIRKRKR